MFSVRQRFIGLCFVIGMGCVASVQAEELYLNGVATYQNLGQEKFLAALYLAGPSNSPEAIYASKSAKRMKIHMTTGYSKRRWVNLWMQGMAINNSSSAFSNMADALVQMFDAQSGGLKPNDIVTIEFDPDSGCSYGINGVTLISNQPSGLFELFLSTWIGNVPPSSDFRQAILGEVDSSELAGRLPTFVPSAERIATIESWTEEEPPEPEPAKQKKVAATKPKPVKKDSTTPPQDSAKVADKSATKTAKKQTVAATESGDQKPAKDASSDDNATAIKEIANPLPDIVSPFTKPDADVIQTALAAASDLQSQPAEELTSSEGDSEEDADEDISVDMILAIREYTQDVIRQVYKSIKYPSSALRRGHEGGIRLLVRIDRNGQLVAVETAEPSEFNSLNDAATSAVARAAPFDKIPGVITDDPLEVTLPIRFKIQ